MTELEKAQRRAQIMSIGYNVVQQMTKMRDFVSTISLPFLDEYIEAVRTQPHADAEGVAQAEFLIDNLLALRAYLQNITEINANAQRSGLLFGNDKDVADRIHNFGFAPGSEKLQ